MIVELDLARVDESPEGSGDEDLNQRRQIRSSLS